MKTPVSYKGAEAAPTVDAQQCYCFGQDLDDQRPCRYCSSDSLNKCQQLRETRWDAVWKALETDQPALPALCALKGRKIPWDTAATLALRDAVLKLIDKQTLGGGRDGNRA